MSDSNHGRTATMMNSPEPYEQRVEARKILNRIAEIDSEIKYLTRDLALMQMTVPELEQEHDRITEAYCAKCRKIEAMFK
jgi:hypothetical protein